MSTEETVSSYTAETSNCFNRESYFGQILSYGSLGYRISEKILGRAPRMSLACLVCHGVESPSHSLRSYSVSSSDNEGRCSYVSSFLSRIPHRGGAPSIMASSKVTPQPSMPENATITGPPRLVRSHAVRRDIVRDWNFDQVEIVRR